MQIRPFQASDWPVTWALLEPTFRAGETYTFDRDISEDAAFDAWIAHPEATFVAKIDDTFVGTYYLKRNQAGGGSHVCNCGYVVSPRHRGLGVASALCEHSQAEAIRRGFRAMQFNFVVSTNVGAIRLWKKHGLEGVGRLPDAFEHPSAGLVDAVVMHKQLAPIAHRP